MLHSATVFAGACAAAAGLVGMALMGDGHAQSEHVIVFVASAISTGVVTAMLWLVGQVYPQAALAVSLIVLVLSGVSLARAEVLAFTPWGWVGATYPFTGSSALSPLGTGALAAASIVMAPALLGRLTQMQLSTQAAQWERATAFSFSLDFDSAAALYEPKPRLGRDIRFITPSRRLWATFLLRDLVGQARTPGRLLGGITGTAASGVLMTLSLLPGTPSALLAGAAGIVIYGAAGPLAKGLQHAASVAGDYPLYGVSDRRLLLLHTLFPLVALLTTLITFATVTACINGVPLAVALPGVSTIGVLALALRLSNALKGPLPPSLLTPVNTPVGDFSIVMQIGWAISEPLIAILGALTVTLLLLTPIPLAMLALGVGALLVIRWQKRR
ncbi:hypothetical protein ACXR2W_09745 [Leucobacter sp. HY1908]